MIFLMIIFSFFYIIDVDCGKVLPVLNGAVEYVNGTTHFGSEITYSCTKNYKLNGVSRRYCLDNGQWSDATPKCEGDYFRIRVIYFIFNDDI